MKEGKNYKIQILRAFAIFAVVLIHTCPLGNWQVICRPFVNFAVATFLFLSGYLTNIENDNLKKFFKKRITRVIIPYIIWTFLYSAAKFIIKGFDLKMLFVNLLTAKATGTLYYIFVYIQFVLLTPLLGKLAKSKYRWIGWLISPISIIIFKYYWLISGDTLNEYIVIVWSNCCLGWFTYYYLGLLLGNKIIERKFNIKILSVLYTLSILLQMLEGYGWLTLGESECGTQLKITSLITSTLFLLIGYYYISNDKYKFKNKVLVLIGDYSFGIYLSHMMVIHVLSLIPFYSTIPYIINSIIVITLSLIFVIIGHKISGKKISKWLGFI